MNTVNQIGYKSIVEYLENEHYETDTVYHALKDAKTAINMNCKQMQVHEMATKRKKK